VKICAGPRHRAPQEIVKPTRNSIPLSVLISLLLFCAGCAENPISTKPFDQFSSDVQQLGKSADHVLAGGVTFNQAGYLAQLQAKPNFHMTDLLLQRTGSDYAPPGAQPTYIDDRRAENVLSDANGLLVDYAGALQQLAAPNLVSQATFDQMTKDLGAQSSSLSTNLAKISPESPNSSELNLFSSAAVEAAHLFIEQRRREDLVKVVAANQSAIDQLSAWCERGVEHLENDLYVSYSNQMNALSIAFYKGKSDSSQNPIIKQAVELDATFLNNEDALKALDDAYKAVPKAHQNLAIAVQSHKGTLADLQTLNQSVRRLQSLSGGAKATLSAAPSPSPQASPSPSSGAKGQ
jgi:outer membrane murein-binding lipoprotein Lpp